MSSPKPIRVFLSGEGNNELGSYAGLPEYRTDDALGVLHALLKKIEPCGWVIGDARVWGSIRKYRAKPGADHQDTHNVLGLALDAIEAKCEVLAFSRDIDKDPKRAAAVEAGIALIPKTFAKAPDVIGGVAVPALEAWILALLGHRCSEARNIKETFAAKGVGKKDGPAMVDAVTDADLSRIPADAKSLLRWLDRARTVLPARVKERAAE